MSKKIFIYIFFFLYLIPSHGQEDTWKGLSVDFSKGDLQVDVSQHYLKHTDGTPFLYLGDTAWELLSRLSKEEVELYMENRREKGFTVIQTVILDELDGIYAKTACGSTQLIDGNPYQPNPDYFIWVDKVLQIAESKGLYLALLPTWGDKVDQKWGKGPEIFNEESAFSYGQWLGNRYANTPNIIWVIGGDRSGEGKNYFIWNALAKGIKTKDKRHLMTFHPQGEHSSSFWFHETEWLDFNMIQSGHAQRDFSIYKRLLLPDLNKQPHKPCFDSEPRYENIPINFKPENGRFDDYDIRTTLYQSIFSGACGYTYGCNDVWQMFEQKHVSQCTSDTPWFKSINKDGAWDLIHFRRLWERFDFTNGASRQQVIKNQSLDYSDYPVAFGNDNYLLIYLPKGHKVKIQLPQWQKEQVNLQWMNPRTGELSSNNIIKSKREFTISAPTQGRNNDWVLIVE